MSSDPRDISQDFRAVDILAYGQEIAGFNMIGLSIRFNAQQKLFLLFESLGVEFPAACVVSFETIVFETLSA